MSQFCKTELCSTVQNVVTGIENTCDTTDILFSSFSIDRIEPTNRISKVSFTSLPDACTVPNGHVAYLDDAKVPVIASNCSWIGFDGRVVGSFNENQLYIAGSGEAGMRLDACVPTREICSATDWCQVSIGNCIGAAVKTSGQIWTWGSNQCGRLGTGTTVTSCSPVREFCSATDWCQVDSKHLHTQAVKTSGQIWGWGYRNALGIGLGGNCSVCSPVREFCSATDWCGLSTGQYRTMAIKTSGQIWGWGRSNFGQLGDGFTATRCSPVRERCSATDWCQVSASGYSTAAIKTTGELWVWGSGQCGRLGDGTQACRCSPVREFCSATNWCQVSVGGQNNNVGMRAIKTSGELWAWGLNSSGQLGDGTSTSRCSPVREFCSATDWCQVSAGSAHTAAIKTGGQLWSWGSNVCGLLGDGTSISRCSPVRECTFATDWCQVDAGVVASGIIKIAKIICR